MILKIDVLLSVDLSVDFTLFYLYELKGNYINRKGTASIIKHVPSTNILVIMFRMRRHLPYFINMFFYKVFLQFLFIASMFEIYLYPTRNENGEEH